MICDKTDLFDLIFEKSLGVYRFLSDRVMPLIQIMDEDTKTVLREK